MNIAKHRKLGFGYIQGKLVCTEPNIFFIYIYSARFLRRDIENDKPSVAFDKDIHSNIGNPKNIKKQNKNTLPIEVHSENQEKKN